MLHHEQKATTKWVAGLIAFVHLFLTGCRQSQSPAAGGSPLLTNQVSSVKPAEVLAKFRERASAVEIKNFEDLRMASKRDAQDRAIEMVLFKLTADELSQIGILESKDAGFINWLLATSTTFADGGRAFDEALRRVGVTPAGVMSHGMVGWYVPREQFFDARRALLSAGLPPKEITIVEIQFHLQ